MHMSLMLVLVVFIAGVPSAIAQESRLSEKQKSQLIKRFPKSDANKDGKLDAAELRALRDFLEARRDNAQLTPASNDKADADTDNGDWHPVAPGPAHLL